MTAQAWIAVVIGLAASIEDVAHRRISNWISLAAFAAGMVLHLVTGGWRGGVASLVGSASGFAVFLIFYVLGGMGGGDVKLMAGFGAVLGARQLFEAALWTAACGGLLAVGAIACSSLRALWRRRVSGDATAKRGGKTDLQAIPYAPAIAAGVWLSLVPKG